MAFTIPTTKELATQFLTAIEARINQTTPPVARAFNRVLAGALALFGTGVYKYGADRSLQSLALTATGEGLDTIGENYGVTRKAAVSAVIEITIVALNGTLIPTGTVFVSDSTSEEYTTLEDVIAAVGVAVLNAVASSPGETGNLADGEIVTIGTPIAGADSTALVTDTVTTGEDRETDAPYRRRVLAHVRSDGGGANTFDLRRWAEEVPGVRQAFPYSGKPRSAYGEASVTFRTAPFHDVWIAPPASWHDWPIIVGDRITFADTASNNGTYIAQSILGGVRMELGTVPANEGPVDATFTLESTPGDRTVYIEATTPTPDDAPPDNDWGLPTAGLLEAVRDALLVDPETGLSRQPLGLTDERLYVEPITESSGETDPLPGRVNIVVVINDVVLADELKATFEERISTALVDFLWSRSRCYVEGLDYPGDRADAITEVTIGTVVNGVLRPLGGAAGDVELKIGRTGALTSYQFNRGELGKINPKVSVGVPGGGGIEVYYTGGAPS
jgi:hypothetical protein